MATKKKPTTEKLKKDDYEALGRMMHDIYESHYVEKWKALRMSFLKGVFGGLGGVVGATIVVALLAWLLSLTQNLPFLEDISRNTRNTLEKSN